MNVVSHMIDAYLLKDYLSKKTLEAIKDDLITRLKILRDLETNLNRSSIGYEYAKEEFRFQARVIFNFYDGFFMPYHDILSGKEREEKFNKFYEDLDNPLAEFEK